MAKKNSTKSEGKIHENITKDESFLDPFAYLFSEFDPEKIVVSMARLEPDIWQGVSIKGYLGKLTPGHDEEWIKTTHGGGKYILNKKDQSTGRILGSKTITISGNPRVGSTALTPPVDMLDEAGSGNYFGTEGPRVNIGGIELPYSGNLEEMQKFILFVKAVKSAFPDPPDYNSVLLQALLERQRSSDPLETIKSIKEAAELFQAPEKGSNINDIIIEGIKNAGNILGGLTAPKLRHPITPPNRQITGNQSGTHEGIKRVTSTEIANNIDQKTENVSKEEPGNQVEKDANTMGEREVVLAVCNQIVKSFRLKPALEPARVVRMIDQFLQKKDKVMRNALSSQYSELISDFCEAELEADWSDPETQIESRECFREWYKQIFTNYADPEREVIIL